jgi:hypothetical protein
MPEGRTLHYRMTNDMKQYLTVREQTVGMTSKRIHLFTLRSEGIEEGNYRLAATIDSLHIAVTTPQGDLNPDVSTIRGKNFDMLLSPLGKEVELSGVDILRYDLGPNGTRSISPDFQALFPDLPERPVVIGDTWESGDIITDESDGGMIRITLKSVNRLDGFETLNGMKCARIISDVTGTLEGENEQQRAKMSFNGDVTALDTWYFEYERGILVKALSESVTEGGITISGPQSMEIPMTMEMTVQIELRE